MTRSVIEFFDTSTRPTTAMREAMSAAVVGDDVYGTDPTVRELEERAAELLGMPAALFTPSGTMANLIALRVHARSGHAVVADADTHLLRAETGGIAAVGGLMPTPVAAPGGILDVDAVEAALQPGDDHVPPVGLVWLENTHNRAGGTITDVATTGRLAAVCRQAQVPLHVDGARLLHAALELDVDPAALTDGADSVMLAFSKGLGAPVGSVVAGDEQFVTRARRVRKMLGGGMRQAGVIAAAALVALDDGYSHLADDHRRARQLAQRLAQVPGVVATPDPPPTNMVFVDVAGTGRSARGLADALATAGFSVSTPAATTLRFVLHRDVSDDDVDAVARGLATAVAPPRG